MKCQRRGGGVQIEYSMPKTHLSFVAVVAPARARARAPPFWQMDFALQRESVPRVSGVPTDRDRV